MIGPSRRVRTGPSLLSPLPCLPCLVLSAPSASSAVQTAFCLSGNKTPYLLANLRAFDTTVTLLIAIAAPAIAGCRSPSAATGMASVL